MTGQLEEHYYMRLREAADMSPEEQHLHALDQEPVGTAKRYKAVADSLDPCLGRVLDLGCGTGSFWSWLQAEDPRKIESVTGVDMLPEREPIFTRELNAAKLKNDFLLKPSSMRFEGMDFGDRRFDTAVAIGICGYWGLHAQWQIKSLVSFMKDHAYSGAITFPMFYDGVLGLKTLVRFDPWDIEQLIPGCQIVKTTREFVASW